MKRQCKALLAGMVGLILLAGCGKEPQAADGPKTKQPVSYKDGTYSATSSPDDRGGIGKLTLTLEKGKIVKADYQGIQKDGRPKDADYGKTNGTIENPEFYRKAQNAVKGAANYAPKLIEVQDIDKVDAVSGATVSYRQFVEAGKKALEQAR